MAEQKKYFVYVVKPPRENFPDTITKEEADIVSEHFYYLKDLLEKKVMLLVGRTQAGDFGICVFECDSPEKASEIMAGDPAVKKGVFTAEVYPFNLALFRNLEE